MLAARHAGVSRLSSAARGRQWSSLVAAGLLLLLGFRLDADVARWVAGWQLLEAAAPLEHRLVRLPGHFIFTIGISLALAVWHRQKIRAGMLLFLSGAFSGILVWLLKWCVGRTRPLHGVPAFEFHPMFHGLGGLVGNGNRSFPSGDAALAMTTAVCLASLISGWRWAFYLAAVLVLLQRVFVNAHYTSDVIAGGICGVASFSLAAKILQFIGEKPLWETLTT